MKKLTIVSITLAVVILIIDVVSWFFFQSSSASFYFVIGIAALFGVLPFVLGLMEDTKDEQEVGEMFLEFSRNLAESVNTGTPISKSIINMSKKNYGILTPHVKKLAGQIELGIPVHKALNTFSNDVGSSVISRAVALISEAERAGGEIDYILESVAKSISEVEKLKKERKAAISNLVVQGYIIFFIFIGIMLVMQYKILPLTSNMEGISFGNTKSISAIETSSGASHQAAKTPEDMSRPFLYLLLAQGFFAGLTIGKLTEGRITAGIKHSFILTLVAFLVSTGAKLFLG